LLISNKLNKKKQEKLRNTSVGRTNVAVLIAHTQAHTKVKIKRGEIRANQGVPNMLSYIKRKLSESDSGVNSVATVTSSCGGNSGSGSGTGGSGSGTAGSSSSSSSGGGSISGRSHNADELVRKTSQMSMDGEAIAFGEDALLQELGYRNATDLQETIYGLILPLSSTLCPMLM